MDDYSKKINDFMINQAFKLKNPAILEFGVRSGVSTFLFLDVCRRNSGKLYSVDINDFSNLSNDENWTFIKSRDDNFDFVETKIPREIDIIYLDTLHEAEHVQKIFSHYFKFLKIGGHFYIDDISWLPYLENHERDNFYCEINNKETFERILSIYHNNSENFDISFSFVSSGICRIVKKKNKFNDFISIKTREISFKNLLRNIKKKIKID